MEKILVFGLARTGISALKTLKLKGYDLGAIDDNIDEEKTKILNELDVQIETIDTIDKYDIILKSPGIRIDNPVILKANELNIEVVSDLELAQRIFEDIKIVAITGTNGKTTTTSMLSTIFEHAELDPTILVGGNLKSIGGNVKIGHSDHFITEACEYVDSFLNFNPKIAIVLNIEEDHLDYFSGIDEIKASFNKFGKLLPSDGYFVINGDNQNMDILHDVKAKAIKFGKKESNDVIIENIAFDDLGCGSFDLNYMGKKLTGFKLSVPGLHNIYNATSAIIVSLVSGIDLETVKEGIIDYTGGGRRFERKGQYNGAAIIDDYAHHPTEIIATLDAARQKYPSKEIVAIFQPHTFTRTIALLDEFAEALNEADAVYLAQIYGSAREVDHGDVKVEDLAAKINKPAKVVTVENVSPLLDHDNAVYVFMGAGDIQLYERSFEELLASLQTHM